MPKKVLNTLNCSTRQGCQNLIKDILSKDSQDMILLKIFIIARNSNTIPAEDNFAHNI